MCSWASSQTNRARYLKQTKTALHYTGTHNACASGPWEEHQMAGGEIDEIILQTSLIKLKIGHQSVLDTSWNKCDASLKTCKSTHFTLCSGQGQQWICIFWPFGHGCPHFIQKQQKQLLNICCLHGSTLLFVWLLNGTSPLSLEENMRCYTPTFISQRRAKPQVWHAVVKLGKPDWSTVFDHFLMYNVRSENQKNPFSFSYSIVFVLEGSTYTVVLDRSTFTIDNGNKKMKTQKSINSYLWQVLITTSGVGPGRQCMTWLCPNLSWGGALHCWLLLFYCL